MNGLVQDCSISIANTLEILHHVLSHRYYHYLDQNAVDWNNSGVSIGGNKQPYFSQFEECPLIRQIGVFYSMGFLINSCFRLPSD